MTFQDYKNRIDGVNDRFMELGKLLIKLKNGEEVDFGHILDLVMQSHKNEVNLISMLADKEDNSDIDVPEFMK